MIVYIADTALGCMVILDLLLLLLNLFLVFDIVTAGGLHCTHAIVKITITVIIINVRARILIIIAIDKSIII